MIHPQEMMGEGAAQKGEDNLIVWTGITSATKNKKLASDLAFEEAGSIQFTILLNQRSALDLGGLAKYPYQEEVLLGSPQAFKVKEITKTKEGTAVNITLEQVLLPEPELKFKLGQI